MNEYIESDMFVKEDAPYAGLAAHQPLQAREGTISNPGRLDTWGGV